jgi:hypothetical protein
MTGRGREREAAMVSSYLVCDVCGQFGPPASFLNEDGLRLCYQCWYRARLEIPAVADH